MAEVKIKPGSFVARPEGETHYDYDGFVDSMAARMEEELDALLEVDDLPGLPTGTDDGEVRDRRRLFVAIARGVALHLRDQVGAFHFAGDPPEITIDVDEG